jgi:Nuclease-related domain
MTWLIKKSHRSPAPSNAQGRDGARPSHSAGAAGPHAGPAAVGPAADPPGSSGRLGAHEASDPPDPRDPSDRTDAPGRPDVPGPPGGARTPADSAPEQPTSSTPASGSSSAGSRAGAPDPSGPNEPTGPSGQAGGAAGSAPPPPEPTADATDAEQDSATRAARLNAAFRTATRNVWPGTENRQAEGGPAAAAEPRPGPAQPGDPALSSFGPLGAGADANRRVWEPRRLHQVPHLRRPSPRPSAPGPAAPGNPAPEDRTAPQAPQPRAPQPRAPEPRAPQAGASQAGAPQQDAPPRPGGPPPRQGIPVNRLALPAGTTESPSGPDGPDGPAPGPGRRKRRNANRPNGPAYLARSDWDGTDHKADRLKFGDLMADTRMRIWRRRLLIAAVAGLVFAFIFTWRAGLTAAVLAAIADVIYRSRTTASMPPGVRLTGAEKRTQRQLARMERSGYRALHSRPIPGSREQIDHFVVGPTGAYAIDSEAWNKNLPIRTRNGRQLWHGPFSKKDRLEHARWEAEQASQRLTAELGHTVYVRPVLAVYGPGVPWNVATIREVDVFRGDRLRKYLRRNALLKERPRLSKDEVEQIYAAAASVLPLNNADQHAPVG